MKCCIKNIFILWFVSGSTCAFPSFLDEYEGAGVSVGGANLNTRGNNRRRIREVQETDETSSPEGEEPRRLSSLLGGLFDTITPPTLPPPPPPPPPADSSDDGVVVADAPSDPSVYPRYNPLVDAKCFNEEYKLPRNDFYLRRNLYKDYVRLFEWGLENPSESPIHAESSDVTSNRFPGMCLRLGFHDNTIDPARSPFSAQEYVAANLRDGSWIGPSVMETSGGDASLLLCPIERLHPNNDYDQTASRVLYAFQTNELNPRGPGIKDWNGSPSSLMAKYQMSYADALHNCALAAITFLTETKSSASKFESKTEFQQSDAVDYIHFGRLDACHVTSNSTQLRNPLEYRSRIPLCGISDILPGVGLRATEIHEWFVSRGMAAGAWASLFGTHTTLDNFQQVPTLRNFGVPDFDYFEDFVGCPLFNLSEPVTDDEEDGCEWTPKCPSKKTAIPKKWDYESKKVALKKDWPMVQSDCATGEFYDIGLTLKRNFNRSFPNDLGEVFYQTDRYVKEVGSWVPDCVCAMIHFGGPDNTDCVGPNAVFKVLSNSLFGSFYTQNPQLQRSHSGYFPSAGEARFVGYNSKSISVGSDGTLVTVDTHDKGWTSFLGDGWSDFAHSIDMDAIAVVSNTQFMYLDLEGKAWVWYKSKWEDIAKNCQAVAAASCGALAVIKDSDKYVFYKSTYDDSSKMKRLSFTKGSIDLAVFGENVDDVVLYYIKSNGDVYRTSNWDDAGRIVGSYGIRISAANDGTIVLVRRDGSIWKKADRDDVWTPILRGSDAVDIAVFDKDTLFLTQTWVNSTIVYRARLTSISPRQVGSGAGENEAFFTTTKVGDGASRVSAASDGTFGSISTLNLISVSNAGSLRPLNGDRTDIDFAIVKRDKIYKIDKDHHINLWVKGFFGNYTWARDSDVHTSEAISTAWDGSAAVISRQGRSIFYKTNYSPNGRWFRRYDSEGTKDVALVGGGIMYYIDVRGNAFRASGYDRPGVWVGNNVKKIAAAEDGTVVAVSTGGVLWTKAAEDDTSSWIQLDISNAVDVAVVNKDLLYFADTSNAMFRLQYSTTSAPTGAPTNAPTNAPTDPPTDPPTDSPVTKSPITSAPATSAPTSAAPVTAAPTDAPVASNPVTPSPITPVPSAPPGTSRISGSAINDEELITQPLLATSDGTATTTPIWWDSLSNNFSGIALSRCGARGNVPPSNGSACSSKPKTCFFGNQACEGVVGPDVRCFCDGAAGTRKWDCQPVECGSDWN